MRCSLIIISNSNYPNCFDGRSTTGAALAAVLERDAEEVERAFRQRFGAGSVQVTKLLDLNRSSMAGLDRTLYGLATPTASDEQPAIRDGDLVVLWIAGYGVSIRGSEGAVLLPVDVRSGEAPLQSSLADHCSIRNKIVAPVRNINQTGVVHLVLNLFHERSDYSPMVEPSCFSGKNLHILASLATSPEQFLGTTNEAGTSPLCHHYCNALVGRTRSSSSSLEDVCREAVRGVCKGTGELLVPWVWHNLVEPSAGATAGVVAEFVWMAARLAEVQPDSSGAAAPAVPQEVHSTQGGSGGVAIYGSNVMRLPTEVAPVNEWQLFKRHRGPHKMRVAEIRVESQDGQSFEMPKDQALIKAMRSFVEQEGFIGFSIGPDRVVIYESCSREDLVSTCTKSLDWSTHVLQRPGSESGSGSAGGCAPSARWASADVENRTAVRSSELPVATLTFEEDCGHEGYLGFKDNAFLPALRMLCEEKLFTAACVGVGQGGWLDPVEVNPPESRRKYSSAHPSHPTGAIDGNNSWYPQTGHGEWTLLDLGESQCVQGLVIQGHPIHNRTYYVKEVKVDCGLTENELFAVQDLSNNDAHMAVTVPNEEVNARALVDFPKGPVLARYVKISPLTHNQMRVGVRTARRRGDGGVKVQFYRAASRQGLLRHRVQDERSTLYLR